MLHQIQNLSHCCYFLMKADIVIPHRMKFYAWVAEMGVETAVNVCVLPDRFSQYLEDATKFRNDLQGVSSSVSISHTVGLLSSAAFEVSNIGSPYRQEVWSSPDQHISQSVSINAERFSIRDWVQKGLKNTFAYIDRALVVQAVAKGDGVQLWIPMEVWDNLFADSFRVLSGDTNIE